MKTLVVYAHPKENSFNHAILDEVCTGLKGRGHEVRVKDLYQHPFNGILSGEDLSQIHTGKVPADILAEQADVSWAQQLVFIYPFWWWDRPAILKGWIDRTLIHGYAYESGPNGVQGKLKHKKAMVVVTCGNSEDDFRKLGVLEYLHKPMTEGTLKFCGVQDVILAAFYDVGHEVEKKRQEILSTVKKLISNW